MTTWTDDSAPLEKFYLAERKLANVNSCLLTVNFLKNDQPFDTIRIMAFDNISC